MLPEIVIPVELQPFSPPVSPPVVMVGAVPTQVGVTVLGWVVTNLPVVSVFGFNVIEGRIDQTSSSPWFRKGEEEPVVRR